MLDVIKALDWVKDNIAAFGGDPDNVTISGFSAGGRDVMAMLVSPMFAGKFQKAIAFSGGMTIADVSESVSAIAAAVAPLAVEDGKAADEDAAKEWLMTDGADVHDKITYQCPSGHFSLFQAPFAILSSFLVKHPEALRIAGA